MCLVTTFNLQPVQGGTTDDNNQPQQPIVFIVQPYNAVASYACRSVLEEVDTGGWCASKLGVGPEYPGLMMSQRRRNVPPGMVDLYRLD
jgi:hypothetical protein